MSLPGGAPFKEGIDPWTLPAYNAGRDMKIRIKPFAVVKDLCGFDDKEEVVPAGTSVEEAFASLAAGLDDLRRMRKTLLFAVNEEYCTGERVLREGDVLAIFPPVSGG